MSKILTPNPPAWLAERCRGTTTDPRHLLIVWEGTHLAIVKTPGSTGWIGVGMSGYHSTVWELLRKGWPNYSTKLGLHSTVEERQGRVLKSEEEAWIKRAIKLDAEEPRTRVLAKIEEARKEAADQLRYDAERAEEQRLEALSDAAPAMLAALRVIVTTPKIIALLEKHDPKALAQARKAVRKCVPVC